MPQKSAPTPLFVAKLIELYERVQVELHGKYSVERVAQVHAYERTYSTRQCVLVLLATPVPCLAVIVLTDLVPLESPRAGYDLNRVFWVRVFVVAFTFVATVFEQMRRFVTGLPLSTRVLWAVSMLIAACSTVFGYLVASLVGFPIPFTIIMCSPCSSSLMMATGVILWSRLLRENSQMRQDVLTFTKIVVVQFSLTAVYPAYNFLFVQLDGFEQTLLALLLPVLKVMVKNAISAAFSARLEDFKPEVVTFNVEVFHALFVSFCMQNSTSWTTTMVLMVVDLWHVWFSLRDVHAQLCVIEALEIKLQAKQKKVEAGCAGETKAYTKSLALIEKAMYFAHHDPAVGRDPAIRLVSVCTKAPGSATVFPAQLVGQESYGPQKRHVEQKRWHGLGPMQHSSSTRTQSTFLSVPTQGELLRLSSALSRIPEDTKNILNVLTTSERISYVTTTLQALHIAEFLLLIEFVEVIIPVVYCVYLTAMFYLPNRVYYPQLASMDTDSLLSTIGNVLAYAVLEFVSFVGLCVALRRKLQLSPLHQLAFVLHSQWNLVQSKLILWVMFAVQISLAHFGYDFSFQFAWLHSG